MTINASQQTEKGYLHTRSPYFGKLPVELMHDKTITDGAKVLYGHMHWRYGQNCTNFEGRESMADCLGVSEVTITNRVAELVENDWVIAIHRGGKNSRISNFYHVFEMQDDCRKWRIDHKHPKPVMEPRKRKSRSGVGGRPTHKETQVNKRGINKLEFTDNVNSGLHDLDPAIQIQSESASTHVPAVVFDAQKWRNAGYSARKLNDGKQCLDHWLNAHPKPLDQNIINQAHDAFVSGWMDAAPQKLETNWEHVVPQQMAKTVAAIKAIKSEVVITTEAIKVEPSVTTLQLNKTQAEFMQMLALVTTKMIASKKDITTAIKLQNMALVNMVGYQVTITDTGKQWLEFSEQESARKAKYNEVFGALRVHIWKIVEPGVPASTGERIGSLTKVLMRDYPDITEQEIAIFTEVYTEKYPDAHLPKGEKSFPDNFRDLRPAIKAALLAAQPKQQKRKGCNKCGFTGMIRSTKPNGDEVVSPCACRKETNNAA